MMMLCLLRRVLDLDFYKEPPSSNHILTVGFLISISRRPTVENPPPFPTHFPGAGDDAELSDVFYKTLHRPSDPTIIFQDDESETKTKRTGAKLAKVRTKK